MSGATAYRDGEFLYQDYLYDDHGAHQPVPDPNDPRSSSDSFAPPNGTYTYPSGSGAAPYDFDAADLVEFRVKPLADSTAFRVTLNTMEDPSLIAFSVSIGDSPGAFPFPYGANVRTHAQYFLTVHPDGTQHLAGELVDATTQLAVPGIAPAVSVDTTRRQVEVRISHTQWNPGTSVVKLTAGVGLWDKANGRYLLPQLSADATHPGGSGGVSNPAAFFNVAFRTNEGLPQVGDAQGTLASPAWWRDQAQGAALAAGDISALSADVDFAKLAAGADDDSAIPASGPIDRILQSHTEYAQGARFTTSCFQQTETCPGEYTGQLHPYSLSIPSKPAPAGGYGFTLLLHGAQDNYNEFENTRYQSELGERGAGSLVAGPQGRAGRASYMAGPSGVEVFEMWADVAAHYPLNPDWSATTGYSEGAIGSFALAQDFPDLFGRIQSTVGFDESPGAAVALRNVPVLMWDMATDELDNAAAYGSTAAALDHDGNRYELDVFAPGDHTTFALNDEFTPVADFLGSATVDRNPAHVDYVVDPAQSDEPLDFNADHAYWLSGISVRTSTVASVSTPISVLTGSVDAVSHGFGVGDAPVSAPQLGAGTLTGGYLPVPLVYISTARTWGPAPATPVLDELDITLTNVASLTIDVARAHVDCNVDLRVTTDGPVTVKLHGCNRELSFG